MDRLYSRMLEMELTGRKKRSQSRFLDVVKEDVKGVGVTEDTVTTPLMGAAESF